MKQAEPVQRSGSHGQLAVRIALVAVRLPRGRRAATVGSVGHRHSHRLLQHHSGQLARSAGQRKPAQRPGAARGPGVPLPGPTAALAGRLARVASRPESLCRAWAVSATAKPCSVPTISMFCTIQTVCPQRS